MHRGYQGKGGIMKVKDLIEALQKLDPELMVVRAGYEGGVTEINQVTITRVALNVNEEWYYGEHEEIDEFTSDKHKNAEQANVVELT